MVTKTSGTASLKTSKVVRNSLEKIQQDGRKVQVLGRVKDGKLEIDQASLAELSKKFPSATFSFVAVNAPFDPVPASA